jgi:hypothetical protein
MVRDFQMPRQLRFLEEISLSEYRGWGRNIVGRESLRSREMPPRHFDPLGSTLMPSRGANKDE